MSRIFFALAISGFLVVSGVAGAVERTSDLTNSPRLAALVQSPQQRAFTPRSIDGQWAQARQRCPAVKSDGTPGPLCPTSAPVCCQIKGEYVCKAKLSDCTE